MELADGVFEMRADRQTYRHAHRNSSNSYRKRSNSVGCMG